MQQTMWETARRKDGPHHLLLLSPTGSGKTLAYLLPMLELIRTDIPAVQAIVVLPTRELALHGEEMLRRFWEAFVRGGYPGHGETLLNPEEVLWWSHGGRLRGESWKRMKFLLGIMKQTPGYGMAPGPFSGPVGTPCGIPERPEDAWRTGYRIHYFSFMRPAYYDIRTDGQDDYRVEVIDSWNMTVEDRGIHRGNFRVVLPGRPYMAIRVWKDKAYRPE